jgi:type I restriction enzyme S subunit
MKVGTIVKIFKGERVSEFFFNLQPEAYRYLQIEDLRPEARFKYTLDKKGVKATKNDVVIAWDGANAGTVGFNLEGYIGSTLAILQPTIENLYGPFLGYFLRSKFSYLQATCTGATIPHINRHALENLELECPPLQKQYEIVEILKQTDRLRRLRRHARELGDQYLQQVFVEMFGDPVENPKGWKTKKLGDLISKFEGGVNFPPISEGEKASDWRVLKISAVTWGEFNPYESKPIHPDVKFNNTLIVKKGDLIMSRANTSELVAAVCLVNNIPPKVLLPDKLWRICFPENSEVLPEFVLWTLRQAGIRKLIESLATGSSGSMKNISKPKAGTIPIPLVPLPLQQRFAEIVRQYERVRVQQVEAERQAEQLFQSLLREAFGE